MFYIEKDNKIVLFDENKQNLINTIGFMPDYNGLEIKEVQDGYVIVDFELMTEEEAEEKEKQEKRNRLDLLCLTAADVERAIYKAFGKDFDDIITMVETLQTQGSSSIDIKALKIELKANNFYRGNSYVNAIGTLLGVTSSQLDEFFETNDYTKLITVEEETTGE